LNTKLTVAIILAAMGVAQALFSQVLAKWSSRVYRQLIGDLTKTESQLELDTFFQHSQLGASRLDKIASITTIAGVVASQCVALLLTAAGAGVLAWAALATGQEPCWFVGSVVFGILSLGMLVSLLSRFARNKLLTFGMGLRGNDKMGLKGFFMLRSATPFVCFQLAATAFAAVAAVVF
jgi:hypothetical protein